MPRLRVQLILLATLAIPLLPAASSAGAASQPSVVKHVRVNGVGIGYRIVGKGRPLVLIPGYGFTMAEWDPELVGALSKQHRVVLFDNRGAGTSSWQPRKRLTIALMASDTAALIRALRLGRPDVLGWSMGGYIAQDLALRHPRLVRRLVLASTDFGGGKAKQPTSKVIAELSSGNRRILMHLLFPTAPGAARAWRERIHAQAVRLHLPPSDFNIRGAVITQQVLAAGVGWESPGHGSYMRLPRLRSPSLVAAGNEDVVVPWPNPRRLMQRIRGSVLLLYAGAGHAFLFQNPLAVAAQFNSFLG
jgi:pimeloyl-ACP methyl ester carboxylesterase